MPSAVDWFRERYACDNPAACLSVLLGELIREQAPLGARIALREAARARGIHAIQVIAPPASSSGEFNAILQPDEHGFTILVNGIHGLGRRRFSVAHEIVHTYFYDNTQMPPVRPYGAPVDAEEEKLCDIGAAELLVPGAALGALGGVSRTAAEVMQLAGIYEVSLHAMARRLVETGTWPDATIAQIAWIAARERGGVGAHRVTWSASTDRFAVPPGCRVKDGARLLEVLDSRSPQSGTDCIRLGELNGVYTFDIARVGGGALCVFLPAPHRDDGEQMLLSEGG
jgi:hypothetical protein